MKKIFDLLNSYTVDALADSDEELLSLAEEASELAKAALKLHRLRTAKVTSPIRDKSFTEEKGMKDIVEEYLDVMCAFSLLDFPSDITTNISERLLDKRESLRKRLVASMYKAAVDRVNNLKEEDEDE